MSSPPDIDPYGVLGVARDATIAEIRASHRKRVLKCHPDKIQDESQRIAAQDEFQKVQQAYELLSDETRRAKHDQKVKIAELKRELLERRRTESSYGSPRGSGSSNREYRNGRIVEERVPMEVFFEESMRFTDEPRSMSRKFDEYGTRPKPKTAADDKKKPRTPLNTYHAAKEQRESAKATQADRQKTRDQERRRQMEAKFEIYGNYDSEDDASDSSDYIYKRSSATPRRERESRSRPSESSRRQRVHRYEEEANLSDNWKTKIDNQYCEAEDYIKSKGRASKSPRAHRGYDITEPESSGSRRSRQRSSSRNPSYEDVDSPRAYESKPSKPAKMPTSTTSPGIKASFRPPFLSTRAQTTATGYVRPKRESREPNLRDMVDDPLPRPSRRRDRNDSGYSSPNTPEMPLRGASPKTSSRYKVTTEEPTRPYFKAEPKRRPTRSPERERERERPATRATPKRSTTYQYPTESPRAETRPSRTSRLDGDVQYISPGPTKYTRAYKYDDVQFARRYDDEYRQPHIDRRQSAY